MAKTTVAERVRKGVALLDKAEPGWVDRIDLYMLDLADFNRCIMGQLHGNFTEGLRTYGLFAVDADAHRHGFDTGSAVSGKAYAELTSEWARIIKARRAQGVPA